MTLNPLAALEKLINEHGSAVILEKRLALKDDESAVIVQKNTDLAISLSEANAKIQVLESEKAALQAGNHELREKLAQYEQRDERLDEKEEQVLRFFFDAARELSSEDVVSGLGFTKGIVDHFILDLLKMEFLVRTRPGTIGGPRGNTPAMYRIDHLGSSHIMKKG